MQLKWTGCYHRVVNGASALLSLTRLCRHDDFQMVWGNCSPWVTAAPHRSAFLRTYKETEFDRFTNQLAFPPLFFVVVFFMNFLYPFTRPIVQQLPGGPPGHFTTTWTLFYE